jgi:ribosomal protein S10
MTSTHKNENLSYKIILRSIDKSALNVYVTCLSNLFKQLSLGHKISGTPKKQNKITLLRSPHKYKRAMEQFEIKKYKTIFILQINVHDLVKVNQILKYNTPTSVGITVQNFNILIKNN